MSRITNAFREGYQDQAYLHPTQAHSSERLAFRAGRVTRHAPYIPYVMLNVVAQVFCFLSLALQAGCDHYLNRPESAPGQAAQFFASAHFTTDEKTVQFFTYIGITHPRREARYCFQTVLND